ncbi:MAG TPA: family 16 glycoside hydrolase [Bacteroidota bacterium]|nr:family 16 glycoside hydrolase [Bacteroidota bacterium]
MKQAVALITLLFSLGALAYADGKSESLHPVTDAYDGWRLAVQAWTFKNFTFSEAVEKVSSLGLDWIEAYPGQRVRPEASDLTMGPELPPAERARVRQMLADAGVRLVNFGVVDLGKDEASCRRVFDFAKEMGIETIVAEPPEEMLNLVERLCKEYKIKVALHNHPKPAPYWNPDRVLEVCKGRSAWIGSCSDIGHWIRSGINPIDAIRKLGRRVLTMHFKDLNQFGNPDAHDVIWGTGVANVPEILKELDRQKYRGVFSVEYEYNWDNSLPDVRACVQAFDRLALELKPGGWHDVLADDLSNCIFAPGSWAMEDGVLTAKGGDDIWTKERYGDFILDLEFKLDKETNSGVFLRTGDVKNWLHTAIEVQVLDSYGKESVTREDCGAIFDCLAPSVNAVKPPGKWNHYTITCKGSKITVVLNGLRVIDMDLNRWTKAHRNPDGTPNKFNTAYKDMPRVGNIGLQYHGHPVWYRNVKIRTLS